LELKKYGEEYFCGPLCEILDIVNDTAKLYRINEVKSAETVTNENPLYVKSDTSLNCKYCMETYCRSDYLKSHIKICKEKEDVVRCLEINLNINMKNTNYKHECRFCNKNYTQNSNLTRHIKTCKEKQEYRIYLEAKFKEKTKFKE